MANTILADFVKESSTTTGTGTYSLAGAVAGFRGFVAAGCAGAKVPYVVTDGANYEIGLGTITDAATDTLSRDVIYASSNSGAAVNWSAGTRDVYLSEITSRPSAVHTVTSGLTLGYVHALVLCNSASAMTIALPAAADYQSKEYTITNINTGKVTIDANSTETIRDPVLGSAETLDLWVTYDTVRLISDGSAWWVISRNLGPHRAQVSRSAAQSVTSATATQVNFDTIDFQVGASVDLAQTDEILINRAGNYIITAQSSFQLADAQHMYIHVRTNGGTEYIFNRVFASATVAAYMNVAKRIQFSANTRLGMLVRHEGTTQNTLITDVGKPILSVTEVV